MSTKRFTTESFIEKAINKHGDKYDYSLVDYKNSYTKVKIICPDHDVFEQAPRNHLSGYGCSKCSGFILTTCSFINKAKDVHGDKYDYSLVDYKGSAIKVKIICDKKHIFNMRPNSHITGQGCPKCTGRQKVYSELIEWFKSIHGNRYDYSMVDYKGCDKKIKIICPIHDVFNQTPNNHYKGAGCPKCGLISRSKKNTKTTKEFIEKSKLIHGDKYKYDKVDYKGNRFKVIISCSVHGDFEQLPSDHIRGTGCNKCCTILKKKRASKNPTGWNITNWESSAKRSKRFDSFKVYIIKCWNNEEEFYKVGRTFMTIKNRFSNNKTMPYNYEIIHELIFGTAKGAYDKENELKKLHKEYKYLPKIKFGGQYECFSSIQLLK